MSEQVLEKAPPEITKAHYSNMVLHRKCPQAWVYRYVRNLEPLQREVAPALDFGNWWHAVRAADSLERGREHQSLREVPSWIKTVDSGPKFAGKSVTVEEVMQAAEVWWKRQPEEVTEEWLTFLGQDLPGRLRGAYRRWNLEWADDLAEEQPLAVEMYWERNIKTAAGNSLRLYGFIDEVFYDARRNLIVVRDNKTSGSLGQLSSLDDMMDSQLQLYAWGAAPQIEKWGLGKVRAVGYDRVRSKAPKTPELTLTTGTLKKSITDYDWLTYEEWATGENGKGVMWGEEGAVYASGKRKGEPKWGVYLPDEKVLKDLKSSAKRSIWFQRTMTPINLNLVRVHLQSALDTVDDQERTMARFKDSGSASRNLASSNCKWCDFASLCRAEMFGGAGGAFDLAEHNLRERA